MAERIAIVGGGRMGEALLAGLLSSGEARAEDVVVAEPDARRREDLERRFGVSCLEKGCDAVREATLVVLAVKPPVIGPVVREISEALPRSALVVSIAAGVKIASLQELLPGVRVVRVMPNAPAMVGEGASVVSGGSPEDVERVCRLFDSVGKAYPLPERHQDAATAVSGSGPAYVAMFVDALARAGVRHGLPRDVALGLAVKTVKGAAVMLEETGMHPEELVDQVASPGGTTASAVEMLEVSGFRGSMASAVTAAVRRSEELGE